ncbi:MAG: type II secretion system F family protein, partial [Bilophila wadsworthia]
HMTRTLGMLLKNGVTLLKALHIVKSVADNKLMAQAVQNMIDGVQAGRDLSEFMNDPLVFPPLSRQMVAAGERSGQLGEMLLWVANDSENRVASRLQVVTSLMEPVMILLLGGIVGFVVIAIILPIFEMSTLAG